MQRYRNPGRPAGTAERGGVELEVRNGYLLREPSRDGEMSMARSSRNSWSALASLSLVSIALVTTGCGDVPLVPGDIEAQDPPSETHPLADQLLGCPTPAPTTANVTQVYILAGQSNMVGLAPVAPLAQQIAHPDTGVVIRVRGSVDPNLADRFAPLEGGFGATVAHFGPELRFGIELERRRPQERIVLAKYAVRGSSMAEDWLPRTGALYHGVLTFVRWALAEVREDGDAELAGLVWRESKQFLGDAFHPGDVQPLLRQS